MTQTVLTLADFLENYDFASEFFGSQYQNSMTDLTILNHLSIDDISCPTCDNNVNPSDGRCPKVFTYPEKIYVTKYHYHPYINHFKLLEDFIRILQESGSTQTSLHDIWTTQVAKFCPKNLEDFLAPIKAVQIEFHSDSIIYKSYDILVERMTQFHKNVWEQSPFLDKGVFSKYPNARFSPILREVIANRELQGFSIAQDAILQQIRVEMVFPQLRLR